MRMPLNTKPLDLLVFTDLDGTLLDHQTYDWSPAKPAVQALRSKGAGLILASSKTAAEIVAVRKSIQMEQWPSIVENGAGVLAPYRDQCEDATHYQNIRDALSALPLHIRTCFIGFADMSISEVAENTGLSQTAAALAKDRAFSEPGLWQGDEKGKLQFIDILETKGITAQQGGRFLTLSFGADKADQIQKLTKQYNPARTIALGDAPNDIAMLEAAHIGVVLLNPHSPDIPMLSGEKEGKIIRTTDFGPAAWNAIILELLNNQQPPN